MTAGEIKKKYVMVLMNVAGQGIRPMVNVLGAGVQLARASESLPEFGDDEQVVAVFVATDQNHFQGGTRMRVFSSLRIARRKGFAVPELLAERVGDRAATWVAIRPSACGTPELAEVFRNFHYLHDGVWKGPEVKRRAARRALQEAKRIENRLERIADGGRICC